MSTIHGLNGHATGGLDGIQSSQRDWSPYLVHFTSAAAMASLRHAVPEGCPPAEVANRLTTADAESFQVVEAIAASQTLRAGQLPGKGGIAACASFSECSLPGLIGLCERYGRFGFGFTKGRVFANGGRPCAYLAYPEYNFVRAAAQGAAPGSPAATLYSLCNPYNPPGAGGAIQDFTHEREWRVFGDFDLAVNRPDFLIAPSAYVIQVRELFPDVPVGSHSTSSLNGGRSLPAVSA